MSNAFEILSKINVNGHTEKKNGLTYLSWAWAWAEVKKAFPDASYTIYENANGWNYHTDGRTAWVKTGVTIEGLEHIEYLPVMDFKNRSIPADQLTSFDVNKAIQRSLTKAVARHGLGLYIYAGEDLPEGEEAPASPKETAEINAVDQGIKNTKRLKELGAKTGLSGANLKDWRNMAIDNKIIPDRKWADYTDAEMDNFCKFVEVNNAGNA